MSILKEPKTVFDRNFHKNVTPTKVTESKKLKTCTESWGIITNYYLESIKINCSAAGVTSTVATLKIGDVSGQIVCIVRGCDVGVLFDLSPEDWSQLEMLCNPGGQIFYRYFRHGLKSSFNYEQKIFYHFCATSQKKNTLVAVYRRGVNQRNKDRNEAFLEILELKKCDGYILDLYTDYLRKNDVMKL